MTYTTRRNLRSWLVALALVALGPVTVLAQLAQDPFPRRVLITNDNGIDDPKIIALARAFSQRAETWVVAPSGDRSGSGVTLLLARQGSLEVERRDIGADIQAYAVDGYPADCVILALVGLMKDTPPDLIISGINGGENLGTDWMGSGTVGAARVAALAGVPALAVSGLDDDLPGAVDAAVDWLVRLAGNDLARDLEPLTYLTVSLPRTVPDSILGVRFTDRAPPMAYPRLEPEGETTWRVVAIEPLMSSAPEGSDQEAIDQRYIAVVPMRVGEVDVERLARWRRVPPGLPAWP